MTASPYYATQRLLHGPVLVRRRGLHAGRLADTVYVIGSYNYGEMPCNTKGVGCGNGRSNGRAVIYSTTAGDPEPRRPGKAVNRHVHRPNLRHAGHAARTGAASARRGAGVRGRRAGLHVPLGAEQHPPRPARDRRQPVESDPDLRGLGWRGDPHRWDVRRPVFPVQLERAAAAWRASLDNCGGMLSRVPNQITHIDRNLDTLQFINVAINPSNPAEVQGGTQDNGTWSNNDPVGDRNTWPQNIYGDGGNSGYDGTNSTWRFNQFTSAFSDSNFQNGDPTKWVIASAPIVNSGEAVGFYFPQVADPNPPDGAHPIFAGAQHVWRTWAFGAGTPGAVPQDKNPNIAFYEANCPEFTTSGADPACGDYQPMGGDLTGNRVRDRPGGWGGLLDYAEQGRPWNTLGHDVGGASLRDAHCGRERPGDGRVAPDRQRDLTDEISKLDLS